MVREWLDLLSTSPRYKLTFEKTAAKIRQTLVGLQIFSQKNEKKCKNSHIVT